MRFSELCKKKKVINIGYVGGSITEDDKYRSHVLKYLEAKYSENSFVEIKGGVSGTPSYLGVHRFDRDVLSQNPDLVFIDKILWVRIVCLGETVAFLKESSAKNFNLL